MGGVEKNVRIPDADKRQLTLYSHIFLFIINKYRNNSNFGTIHIFSSVLTYLPCFTPVSRPDGPETRVKTAAFILSDVSFILCIHNCKRQFTGVSVVKHLEVIIREGFTELGSGNT